MKPLAKLGYLAAACALLATTFSIIGPRAVRAAVATLVQVSNTPASPVPTVATDNPALQPYAASASSSGLSISFPPLGKTWVIETLSLDCLGDGSPIPAGQATDVRLFMTTGGNFLQYTFAPTLNSSNQELIVTQPIRAYEDPGTAVFLGSGSGLPAGWTCYAVVSGHLVNPL